MIKLIICMYLKEPYTLNITLIWSDLAIQPALIIGNYSVMTPFSVIPQVGIIHRSKTCPLLLGRNAVLIQCCKTDCFEVVYFIFADFIVTPRGMKTWPLINHQLFVKILHMN